MRCTDPKPLEDFSMWAALQAGGQQANIPALKELVGEWIQMATQKTAGQRKGKKGDFSWDNRVYKHAISTIDLLRPKADNSRRGGWK